MGTREEGLTPLDLNRREAVIRLSPAEAKIALQRAMNAITVAMWSSIHSKWFEVNANKKYKQK